MYSMARPPKTPADKAQYRRFVEAAKKLATDENKAAFEAVLRKVVKTPAAPKKLDKNSGT